MKANVEADAEAMMNTVARLKARFKDLERRCNKWNKKT